MEIIPPRLKEPAYRLYEMRLRHELENSKSALPRHIAVLCDGNRRWARDAGYDDVSYGCRMGAAKIAEMLRWCAAARIEMATVYLLSTENLQRDPEELADLIEIITDVVEEICAPANRWSVRTVGDLELIGEEQARRVRDAVDTAASTAPTGSFHVNVAVGYGGRQEIVDAVRSLLGKQVANGATPEQMVESVTVDSIAENLYTYGQPDPDSCSGRAPIRRCGSPKRTGRTSGGSTFCAHCATTAAGTVDSEPETWGPEPALWRPPTSSTWRSWRCSCSPRRTVRACAAAAASPRGRRPCAAPRWPEAGSGGCSQSGWGG